MTNAGWWESSSILIQHKGQSLLTLVLNKRGVQLKLKKKTAKMGVQFNLDTKKGGSQFNLDITKV